MMGDIDLARFLPSLQYLGVDDDCRAIDNLHSPPDFLQDAISTSSFFYYNSFPLLLQTSVEIGVYFTLGASLPECLVLKTPG